MRHFVDRIKDFPFYSYAKCLENPDYYIRTFESQGIIEDLKTGEANRVVYWYETYVLTLYELASRGREYYSYLNQFHRFNAGIFRDVFKPTDNILQKLTTDKINENILGEIKIKKGKIVKTKSEEK